MLLKCVCVCVCGGGGYNNKNSDNNKNLFQSTLPVANPPLRTAQNVFLPCRIYTSVVMFVTV